jgi:hypothetical protein
MHETLTDHAPISAATRCTHALYVVLVDGEMALLVRFNCSLDVDETYVFAYQYQFV